MNIRILSLACLLALSCPTHASIAEPESANTLAARATAQAERITNASEFLARVEEWMELARNGGYGQLRRGDMDRLESAQLEIKTLLDGHMTAGELPLEKRIELYNAHTMITSILRKDDKNRMVCRRQIVTGSRFATTECLTVAQREDRARNSSEATENVQRMACIPGEGNPCGREQ